MLVHLGYPFWGREVVGIRSAVVVSCRLSKILHCDHCAISTDDLAAIYHRMSLMLKSTGVNDFGAKFEEEGVD